MSLAHEVFAFLEARGVPAALIGGVALATHGVARATLDVDFLVTDGSLLRQEFWEEWSGPERLEIRRGEAEDPLAGAVRFSREAELVDVVVGKHTWEAPMLRRCKSIVLEGRRLPAVDAADLVLLKLHAGGPQDLLDVRLLLAADPKHLSDAVEARLTGLPEAVRVAWGQIEKPKAEQPASTAFFPLPSRRACRVVLFLQGVQVRPPKTAAIPGRGAAMKFTPMTPELYGYLVRHGHNDDPVLAELAAETEKLGPISLMQIAPEQGTLLSLLARVSGARTAIEIGTFTGYSAICIARGLPADGRLLCCDVNEEWTAIARRYFARAGVAERIDLRIAPALDTLGKLPPDASFDFAFIDADKVSYRKYYEALLPRLRPNGLVVFDNVLWMGQVVDAGDASDDTRALRELNDFIAGDRRVEAVMISVSDGLTIARKRTNGEMRR